MWSVDLIEGVHFYQSVPVTALLSVRCAKQNEIRAGGNNYISKYQFENFIMPDM